MNEKKNRLAKILGISLITVVDTGVDWRGGGKEAGEGGGKWNLGYIGKILCPVHQL